MKLLAHLFKNKCFEVFTMRRSLFWAQGHIGEQNKGPTPWSERLNDTRAMHKSSRGSPGGTFFRAHYP